MSLQRILSILLYILLAASAVLILIFYFGPEVEGAANEEPAITNFVLRWAQGLLVIGAILAIIFPLGFMIANPKNATKALIALVFLGVVVLIGYFLASDQLLELTAYQGTGNNPQTLKWAGTGLISMYLLIGLAVLAIIYSEIAKLFK